MEKLYALACIIFARSDTCIGERQVAPRLCPTLEISRIASVEIKKLAALPGASFLQCSVVVASDKTSSEIIVELGNKITLGRLSLQLKHIAVDGL